MWRMTGKLLLVTAAIIAILLVGFVALNWQPDRSVESLKARWAQPPSTFIDVDGLSVHMRDEGVRDDPVPIVLLHGTSASLHTWDGWVNALKTQRRVIRMDLPAFGLTGPRADDDYSVERYAAFVHTFLDRLGVKRVVLVGNSLGGHVALMATLVKPERVERLILIDSSGYPLAPTSVPLGFRLANMPVFGLIARVTLPRSVIEDSVKNVYGDPARATPELVDRYFELTLREGNRRALSERIKLVTTDAITDKIPQIKTPTLILWGERDHLILLDAGRRFEKDIVGSKLVFFDGLGHVPHEEDAARTVAEAIKFLGLDAVTAPPLPPLPLPSSPQK